jgi:hypothetical protein
VCGDTISRAGVLPSKLQLVYSVFSFMLVKAFVNYRRGAIFASHEGEHRLSDALMNYAVAKALPPPSIIGQPELCFRLQRCVFLIEKHHPSFRPFGWRRLGFCATWAGFKFWLAQLLLFAPGGWDVQRMWIGPFRFHNKCVLPRQ